MQSMRSSLVFILLTLVAAPYAFAATNEVTEPFEGVRLIHSKSTVPRQVDMWIVEIDMSAPGLDFFATPSNGALPGETTPQTTRSFVTQVGAQLGVNASFFESAGGGQFNVQGLSVSNGDAYSEFQPARLVALNVSAANVATIIQATGTSGLSHTPPTSLYNAVGGDARLVANGVNVANSGNTAIHPRTAAGVTADGKLLLFTVDGRNVGHSEGLTITEMANILIRWGARDAINLDGGGSTTLVMDNPATSSNDPQVTNFPSDLLPSGLPGKERAVANSFAVYASPPSGPSEKVFVFSDFEQGEVGTFNSSISFSGSNRGFNRDLSVAEAVTGGAFDGQWSQRLTIIDDPATDGDTQNPGGAWFVRHVSGAGSPANNATRPAIGSVGFWAKTADPNMRISLVVDDASGLTGERGLAQNMIADGQWHPYFWDIEDHDQWEGWVNGDGAIDGHFTLDSIQIFGPPNVGSDLDAVVFIDSVSHITPGPLAGDFNGDYIVDASDYLIWRNGSGGTYTQNDYNTWRANFGRTAYSAGGGTGGIFAVPEPASWIVVIVAVVGAVATSRFTVRRGQMG
jgi:hypothetical protein